MSNAFYILVQEGGKANGIGPARAKLHVLSLTTLAY